MCDGDADCIDYSDEVNCRPPCSEDQFACADGDKCIPAELACNYINDCGDFSDEINPDCICDSAYEFECDGGGCINVAWVCDGETNCSDGSDESMCTTTIMTTEGM